MRVCAVRVTVTPLTVTVTAGCDSFCVNAHKKLLIPFDLAALYVADRRPLLAALALTPEYLRNSASDSGETATTLEPGAAGDA